MDSEIVPPLIKIEDLLTKDIFLRLNSDTKRDINQTIRKDLEQGNRVDRKRKFRLMRNFADSVFTRGDNVRALVSWSEMPLDRVQKGVEAVRRGSSGYNKPVEIKLPVNPTSALALLVAKSMGDGGISSDWRFSYDNNQLELINEVVDSVSKAIGKTNYKLYLRKRGSCACYELKFSSTLGYLLNMVGSPKGIKVNSDFGVPQWIKSGTAGIKSAFLRGIFDDECCIHMRKQRRVITFAMGKSEDYISFLELFFKDITLMLGEFGVYSRNIGFQGKYKNTVMLRFSIYGENNFKTFSERIGFTHSKKDEIMRNILNSFVNIHKTRDLLLNAVENSIEPISTYEISNSTGIDQKLACLHLRNLAKENKILRLHGTNPVVWYSRKSNNPPKSKKEKVIDAISSDQLTTTEISERSGVEYKYTIAMLHRLRKEGVVSNRKISNYFVWSKAGNEIKDVLLA